MGTAIAYNHVYARYLRSVEKQADLQLGSLTESNSNIKTSATEFWKSFDKAENHYPSVIHKIAHIIKCLYYEWI